MNINDFDYNLPEELIAQQPAETRSASRLMVIKRETGTIEHRHFYDILDYLHEGDVLVMNNSRVIPARLFGRRQARDAAGNRIPLKCSAAYAGSSPDADSDSLLRNGSSLSDYNSTGEGGQELLGDGQQEAAEEDIRISPTCSASIDDHVARSVHDSTDPALGAHVEFLLSKRLEGDRWETLVKPGKKCKVGDTVIFSLNPLLAADIVDMGSDGTRIVEFRYEGIFMERLEEQGRMPLPPYIRRESQLSDKERYQTVYARNEGSVAAPTAGLHFTEEILEKAKAKGVELAYVTLHVGIGTFRPVKAERVEDHHMHFEEYEVSPESAEIINRAIDEGRRIISVGTTSTRTLESAAVHACTASDSCSLQTEHDAEGQCSASGEAASAEGQPYTSLESAAGQEGETVKDLENGSCFDEEQRTLCQPQGDCKADSLNCDVKNTTDVNGTCYRDHKEQEKFHVKSGAGSTGIFIYPGYRFKIVDAQITNFHLPKSTLIMLISALYRREDVLKAYECAVEEKYRFFSYGDAMLLL